MATKYTWGEWTEVAPGVEVLGAEDGSAERISLAGPLEMSDGELLRLCGLDAESVRLSWEVGEGEDEAVGFVRARA